MKRSNFTDEQIVGGRPRPLPTGSRAQKPNAARSSPRPAGVTAAVVAST
jgi:hypothetical protein